MYDLETLLDELDRVRERLLVAIEPLPDEALLTKGAVGEWSVADLLAILTAWEAELVTGMMRLDQGKRPDKLLAAMNNADAYSALRLEENQGRDLDRIFDVFQHVRVQVEEWLEEFSQKALNDPRRFKWLNGRSLAEVVAAVTFEHEAQYVPQLEAFTEQWLAQEEETAAPTPFIPLTDVDTSEESSNDKPDST